MNLTDLIDMQLLDERKFSSRLFVEASLEQGRTQEMLNSWMLEDSGWSKEEQRTWRYGGLAPGTI